jgi:hypothetical protein
VFAAAGRGSYGSYGSGGQEGQDQKASERGGTGRRTSRESNGRLQVITEQLSRRAHAVVARGQ